MTNEKTIKNDASRHIGTCMVVNVILLCVARVVLKYVAPDYTIDVALPLVIAFLYAVLESLIVTALWSRTVLKSLRNGGISSLHSPLSTFHTALSGLRLLAILALLFIIYLAVGRERILPFFIYIMVFYFAMLITHTLFFSRQNKKIYEK